MLVSKKLNKDVSPLKARDSVLKAEQQMEELNSDYLPVVDSTTHKLIGQISRKTLRNLSDDARYISDISLEEAIKIYDAQHVFEAMRLMLQYERCSIPVVDDQMTFLGTVRKQEVLEALTGMLNLAEYGSIVTIELQRRDFSLTEIVHLVETEGAKILGIAVEVPDADTSLYEVSIKLNIRDVSRVAASLRRYGYFVSTESGAEAFGMDLETRADELIKYIDM